MAKSKNARSKMNPLTLSLILLPIIAIIAIAWQQLAPSTNANVSNLAPEVYQADFAEGAQEHVLVDVRTESEFASGYIEGAINIPVQELAQRLDELPADATIIVYCRSGNRSTQASNILSDAGYTSIYDMGGIVQWQAAGLPIVQ